MKTNTSNMESKPDEDIVYLERRRYYENIVLAIAKDRVGISKKIDSNKVWKLIYELPDPWKTYLKDEVLYKIASVVGYDIPDKKLNWDELSWSEISEDIENIIK